METTLKTQETSLGNIAETLEAFSPLKILKRGYSLVTTGENQLVSITDQVQVGQEVTVTLQDGKLLCQVQDVIPAKAGISTE